MSIDVSKPRSRVATSLREDLVTALLASWLTIGGFVDGFAHRNLDTPETFFTPWHGILYSGFVAVTAWVVWLILQRRALAGSLRESVPPGYETAVAGILVFMAGGIGDGFWHTLFGIEVSIDALLSPTHLLLLFGALLIVSGPLRSRWREDGYDPDTLGGFLPPLLAVTMGAAELGFFFQYVDGLSTRFMQVPYRPGPEDGYFELVAGFSSILITTVILMGGLLLLLRRWKLPVGSALFFFAVFGGLMETLEGYDFPEDLVAPVIAGVAAELIIAGLRPLSRTMRLRVLSFLTPIVMWGTRFVVFEQFSDIAWPVSVWTGVIFFTGLTGLGLSVLTHPPSTSSAATPGDRSTHVRS